MRPDDDDDSAGNRKSMHFDDEDESKKFVKKERVKVSSTLFLLDENDPSYFLKPSVGPGVYRAATPNSDIAYG